MLDGISDVSDRLLPLYCGFLELRYCFRKGDTNGLITVFFSITIELESQKRILKQKQLFLNSFSANISLQTEAYRFTVYSDFQ